MTEEELMSTAREKFPIGSLIYPYHLSWSKVMPESPSVIKETSFRYRKEDNSIINSGGMGMIYSNRDNAWAELVKAPEPTSNYPIF